MKGSDSCCDDIYSVYIRELVIDLLATIEDQTDPSMEPMRKFTILPWVATRIPNPTSTVISSTFR